jgi:predicted dehydrogenase
VAAAARGLPVLVEKPLAIDIAGAERMCAALDGRPAMASMNRRFDPAFVRLRAHCTGRSPRAWRGIIARRNRDEPEFLAYTGVHLVDLLVHLAGPPDATGSRAEAVQGGQRISWRAANGAEVLAEIRPRLGVEREAVEVSGDGWHAEGRSAWFDDGLVRFRAADRAVVDDPVRAGWPVWRRNGTDAEIAAFLAACDRRGPWSPQTC